MPATLLIKINCMGTAGAVLVVVVVVVVLVAAMVVFFQIQIQLKKTLLSVKNK